MRFVNTNEIRLTELEVLDLIRNKINSDVEMPVKIPTTANVTVLKDNGIYVIKWFETTVIDFKK